MKCPNQLNPEGMILLILILLSLCSSISPHLIYLLRHHQNLQEEPIEEEVNPIPIENQWIPNQEEVGVVSKVKRYPTHLDPLLFHPAFRFHPEGECGRSADGQARFFCPIASSNGKWFCIDEWEICDGARNCPEAVDEDPKNCLFYKVIQSQLQLQQNYNRISQQPTGPREDLGMAYQEIMSKGTRNLNVGNPQ